MKTSYVDGVSRERVAVLAANPQVGAFLQLSQKVAANSATPKEREEYVRRTERARKLDPMVLVD